MSTNFHFDEQCGLITLRVSGTVSRDMFQDFSSLINDIIADHGAVRVMLVMHDFTMTPNAFFADLQFGLHRLEGVERVAVVVGSRWQRMMTNFFSSLDSASVCVFDSDKEDTAWDWVHDGIPMHSGVRSNRTGLSAMGLEHTDYDDEPLL